MPAATKKVCPFWSFFDILQSKTDLERLGLRKMKILEIATYLGL